MSNIAALAAWLRQQLDEDERIAQDAARHAAAAVRAEDARDGYSEPPYEGARWWHDADHLFVCSRPGQATAVLIADCGPGAFTFTPHLAEHQPARVLRAVEAKRKLAALHSPVILRGGAGAKYFDTTTVCKSCEPPRQFPEHAYPCATLRLLAAEYADRRGYREEWKP